MRQRGAVSIFVVIMTSILVATIVTGFAYVMLKDQQQTSSSEVSKSALDSAKAGIEDAKRAIIIYQSECSGAKTTSSRCSALESALFHYDGCETIQKTKILGNDTKKEVTIQKNESDRQLDQAYTCVKVKMNTNEYRSSLAVDTPRMIPLKSASDFNRVVVRWYSAADLQDGKNIDLPFSDSLLKQDEWPSNRPPVIRAQLIQTGDKFRLSDFDKNKDDKSNAHTLFLIPSSIGRNNMSFEDDVRLSQNTRSLQQVSCHKDFSAVSERRYACEASITLPMPIGAKKASERESYLVLSSIYGSSTNFSLELKKGEQTIDFKGVQPVIDSTGRAGDLFRRLESRIELTGNSIPLPEAAVDSYKSFCKTLLVTDNAGDYSSGSCEEE